MIHRFVIPFQTQRKSLSEVFRDPCGPLLTLHWFHIGGSRHPQIRRQSNASATQQVNVLIH